MSGKPNEKILILISRHQKTNNEKDDTDFYKLHSVVL